MSEQRACTATSSDESLLHTGEECDAPAVWGLENRESGATIWHCAKHADEYTDAANAIADSYR